MHSNFIYSFNSIEIVIYKNEISKFHCSHRIWTVCSTDFRVSIVRLVSLSSFYRFDSSHRFLCFAFLFFFSKFLILIWAYVVYINPSIRPSRSQHQHKTGWNRSNVHQNELIHHFRLKLLIVLRIFFYPVREESEKSSSGSFVEQCFSCFFVTWRRRTCCQTADYCTA